MASDISSAPAAATDVVAPPTADLAASIDEAMLPKSPTAAFTNSGAATTYDIAIPIPVFAGEAEFSIGRSRGSGHSAQSLPNADNSGRNPYKQPPDARKQSTQSPHCCCVTRASAPRRGRRAGRRRPLRCGAGDGSQRIAGSCRVGFAGVGLRSLPRRLSAARAGRPAAKRDPARVASRFVNAAPQRVASQADISAEIAAAELLAAQQERGRVPQTQPRLDYPPYRSSVLRHPDHPCSSSIPTKSNAVHRASATRTSTPSTPT